MRSVQKDQTEESPIAAESLSGKNSQDDLDRLVLSGLLELRRELTHFIFSSIPNRSDAEDVYQEVCLKVWSKKSAFTPGTDFRAWVFTIARYTVMDCRKRYATSRVQFLTEESVAILSDEMVMRKESENRPWFRSERLAECLSMLSDKASRILRFKYRDGYSMAELANMESMSVPALTQFLYRSRVKLRECIENKEIKQELS